MYSCATITNYNYKKKTIYIMDRPNRLESQSADGVQLNLDALYQIAPSCFTEALDAKTGEVKRKVDFNTLRQLLGDNAVEDAPEAYVFNWVGKQAARAEVLRPTKKTLRPVKEDSVDWDNTQNLYIEGDNLEVLKLLQKSYLGKVKMIYIDPPYNTGNDFIYHDDFARTQAEEDLLAGKVDEFGNRYIKNEKTEGRYHSDWCSMIYSRLMVARTLLREDGVIFVSIGQEEIHNMTKICDEIFGADNRIRIISRLMKSGGAKGQFFSPNVEYIAIYAKDKSQTGCFRQPIDQETIDKLYTSIETEGSRKGERYRPFGLYQSSLDSRPNQRYYIEAPDGELLLPPGNVMPPENIDGSFVVPKTADDKVWRWTRERYLQEKALGNITFKKSDGVLINSHGQPAKWNVYSKIWLSDREDEGMVPVDLLTKWENRHATKELKEINIPFDFAKPTGLIKYIMQIVGANKESIILDFFSGSATTAHAVMLLNAEDGGKRKYIMVQLQEETPEDSESRKAGYKTIPEVAKERIRRAGKKIKEDSPLTTQDLDTGFRVFRLDEGNFESVEFSPNKLQQEELELFLNNIKGDRNDLDLLFGCMLDWGVQLSLPMTSEVVDGKTIYTVNDGDLVACFAENVTDDVVRAMANKMPLRVIFRDSCFAQDADKINIYETFKQLLDWSDQEVIKNIRVI